jgi:hypothetical protein
MSQPTLSKALKAAYSGAVALLGTLGSALSGEATFSSLSDAQWVWISLATLVAAGGTFGLAGWAGPNLNGPRHPSPPAPPKSR